MRNSLIVTIVAVAVLLAAARAAAADPVATDPEGKVGLAVYRDGMDTTVITPHVKAGATIAGGVKLEASWSADVISSASVDVITAATTFMEETRHELGLSAVRRLIGGLDLDGAYAYSVEKDSDAHVLSFGMRRSLFEKNLELGARYGGSFNRLGVRGEPTDEWRLMWVHSLELSVGHVLGMRTIGELLWSGYLITGYQAGPYRRVPITFGEDLRFATWVDEEVPDLRLRSALTARVRHAFGGRWVGSLDYRFYFDDWGLVNHTASAEQTVELGAITLRLRQRGSVQQQGAWFYRERYEDMTRYRTRDRRLGPHGSAMAGAALVLELPSVGFLGEVMIQLGGDVIVWRFDDFLKPSLSPIGTPELEEVGWVWGALVQIGMEAKL